LIDSQKRRRVLLRDVRNEPSTVSPDERWLAVSAGVGSEDRRLTVVDLRGGEPRQITSSRSADVARAPDSRRLIATDFDGNVIVLDRDGSHRTTISTFRDRYVGSPAWSP
jgi:Tol biopolymer transport system component